MPQQTQIDNRFSLLIGIAILFALLVLLVGFAMFFHDFSRELRYIKSEINRSSGAERLYWVRKRRRLWLSLIPFIKY